MVAAAIARTCKLTCDIVVLLLFSENLLSFQKTAQLYTRTRLRVGLSRFPWLARMLDHVVHCLAVGCCPDLGAMGCQIIEQLLVRFCRYGQIVAAHTVKYDYADTFRFLHFLDPGDHVGAAAADKCGVGEFGNG